MPPGANLRNAPTVQLLELALRQTGNLVRAEASLATAELREDAFGALLAAVTGMAGVFFFTLAIGCGIAAALLASGVHVLTALLSTACILAALGGITGVISLKMVPKKVAARSRERVASTLRDIEDHAS